MLTTPSISFLVDDNSSWIRGKVDRLLEGLAREHDVKLFQRAADVRAGEMLFLLGCTKVVGDEILKRNRHNLVVHESDLPCGRGWSPVSWQVAQGKNVIPIVLFEARSEVDAGPVYFRDEIVLEGTELLGEIRDKQWNKTESLVRKFISSWPNVGGDEQNGTPSYYRKRNRDDDRIDPERSIAEVFDKFRIADNERYPIWFTHRGVKYILKIYKEDHDKTDT